MNRNKIIISGGVGLLLSVLLTVASVLIRPMIIDLFVEQSWFAWLFSQILISWLIFLFLSATSLLEIPLMIYGIQKILANDKQSTINLALFTNGLFVFFAAVYALPNLLLSSVNQVWMGIVLSSFSFIRFGSAIIFLPNQPVKDS